MNKSVDKVMYVYIAVRLVRKKVDNNEVIALEQLHGHDWVAAYQWSDFGLVADYMVDCGFVADHEAAFKWLRI